MCSPVSSLRKQYRSSRIHAASLRVGAAFSAHYLAILFRRKVARQGRPCTFRRERDCIRPVHRASVIDAERDRIDRNEVTMRVVICMSRAATLCCNEELWARCR